MFFSFLPESSFHQLDGVFLGVLGDVDVGLHGFVVRVVKPHISPRSFQTAVHLLVGYVWKRPSPQEILILVLVQDGQCVFVKEDWQAVVCLLGSYGHHSVPYVRPSDFNHVRISEGCRRGPLAEAYGLFVLPEIPLAGDGHRRLCGDPLRSSNRSISSDFSSTTFTPRFSALI